MTNKKGQLFKRLKLGVINLFITIDLIYYIKNLASTEYEIYPTDKWFNSNICWNLIVYQQDK